MTKISVIIPCYNGEKYIERCLNSLIAQNSSLFEVIIVNDGSTDNSEKLINRLIKNTPNFHLINQKNTGVSVARNSGIKHACGEYISFVDSDDYVSSNYIEKLLSFIETNKAADIIQFEAIRNEYRACVWSKCIKRGFLEKYKILFFVGCTLGEDLAFNEVLRIHTNKIAYCNSHIYIYEQNENSASLNYKNRLNIYKTLDVLYTYIKDYDYDLKRIQSVFFRHGVLYPLLFLKEHHIKEADEYKKCVYSKIQTYKDILSPLQTNQVFINMCVESLYFKEILMKVVR